MAVKHEGRCQLPSIFCLLRSLFSKQPNSIKGNIFGPNLGLLFPLVTVTWIANYAEMKHKTRIPGIFMLLMTGRRQRYKHPVQL